MLKYESKKAKQEPENEQLYYAVPKLITDGIHVLRGFNQIGDYKQNNGFGLNIVKFSVTYYETADGEWGWHVVKDLAENKRIAQITEEEMAIIAQHPKIIQKFAEKKQKEEERQTHLKRLETLETQKIVTNTKNYG